MTSEEAVTRANLHLQLLSALIVARAFRGTGWLSVDSGLFLGPHCRCSVDGGSDCTKQI